MTKEKKIRIPVKREDEEAVEAETEAPIAESELRAEENAQVVEEAQQAVEAAEEAQSQAEAERDRIAAERDEWRDKALRLQAEMINFRKRQERHAENRIENERERLLRAMLEVADNLEKALANADRDDPLYQGVKITYDGLLNFLRQEGVEAIEAEGQPFDPNWHEAVAKVPAQEGQEADEAVVAVERRGYRRGDKVLRPARVVVGVKS